MQLAIADLSALAREEAGFQVHAPPAHAPLPEQAIAVAETYLFHGLVEHNPDPAQLVLLADDATRAEQGNVNATTAEAIRTQVGTPQGLKVISGIKNARCFVECDRDAVCEAVVFYDLELNAFGPRPSVLIAERFRVADGLIQEIEAVFLSQTDPNRCSAACFPPSGPGHEPP